MTTQTQDSDVLLTMTDVSKSFPGVKALDHANLTVRSHSVHALMGENGAGKSTLLKCLFGIYAKDEGEILFLGKHQKKPLKTGFQWFTKNLTWCVKPV